MNSGLLRRRILGAFVLVCLVVVLWPVIFTDVPAPFVDTRSQIPQSSTFSEYRVPEPRVPADIAAVDTHPVASEPEPVQAEPEPEPEQEQEQPALQSSLPKPELDARGLPIAWVIQVGSFADAKNGLALKASLQQQGYKAYTETAKTEAGATTRVFVGPMVSKAQCVAEKSKIDKAFSLKSKVIRYVP
jgi:DedD protein